jgi:excisionase family DNA binding protein
MPTVATDELLNAKEAAEYMGVTVKAIYQNRWAGRGPQSFIRGKRIVFRKSDIDAYFERQREYTLRGEPA